MHDKLGWLNYDIRYFAKIIKDTLLLFLMHIQIDSAMNSI